MGVQENIEAVRRFYAAGPADEDSQRRPFFSENAVWHVPGDNPVSGEYRGSNSITEDIGAQMSVLDEWLIEPLDLMGNADLVMTTVRVIAGRGGKRLESVGGHVFRLDEEARIIEAWGFVRDQAGLDDLLRR
jgi:ketosteroid isomerase-like protein